MAGPSLATTRGIDLKTAASIIEAALAVARSRNLRPMSIAVLDGAGELVSYKREDGTGIGRYGIVMGKAYGALVMNRSSREIGRIAEANSNFIQAIVASTHGRLIPSPGGVLVKDASGRIIGAVGSSGDDPNADEACAIEAIRSVGLVPDPAAAVG